MLRNRPTNLGAGTEKDANIYKDANGAPREFPYHTSKIMANSDKDTLATNAFGNRERFNVLENFEYPNNKYVKIENNESSGSATTVITVTNPSGDGTTFRYTWTTVGTDPAITAITFPIGAEVYIANTGLAAGNEGIFTITAVAYGYFEVTNAAGVAEADKALGALNSFIGRGPVDAGVLKLTF